MIGISVHAAEVREPKNECLHILQTTPLKEKECSSHLVIHFQPWPGVCVGHTVLPSLACSDSWVMWSLPPKSLLIFFIMATGRTFSSSLPLPYSRHVCDQELVVTCLFCQVRVPFGDPFPAIAASLGLEQGLGSTYSPGLRATDIILCDKPTVFLLYVVFKICIVNKQKILSSSNLIVVYLRNPKILKCKKNRYCITVIFKISLSDTTF